MELDRYEFVVSKEGMDYWFISEGPKGFILKEVQFRKGYIKGLNSFNLSFGDLNIKKSKIDDRIKTNNKDTKKVLATVAAIAIHFSERFKDNVIYAEGSTPARTRLYQMGIVAHYQEIDSILNVYGYKNNEWQPFKKGINYEAFFVTCK